MEYKIVTAQNILSGTKATEKLTKSVNDLISLGWEPIGGVSFTDSGLVAQALIKRR